MAKSSLTYYVFVRGFLQFGVVADVAYVVLNMYKGPARGGLNTYSHVGAKAITSMSNNALMGDTTLQDTCRRYCWVYELTKVIGGKEGVQTGAFVVWIVLAIASFWAAVKVRKRVR